jgi:hypothetical protein
MTTMASTADRRVFLHVGLHKTGTTYLQNLLRANRVELRAQGVEYLADPDSSQRSATRDLKGTSGRGFDDPRVPGAWDRLVAGIAERDAPSVLISDEGLGGAKARQIHRAVASFDDREVHVVVTVRDIARVLVSQWQEQVKNDHTWAWSEYVAAVRDPAAADAAAARGFWSRQDACAILAAWEREVPASHVHVVTVPVPGTPPYELLRRFSTVVGFDPTLLPNVPRWTNESVGAAGTEVIRRMNLRLGGRLNEPAYSRAVKGKLARALAARDEVGRLILPAEHLDWAREHSDQVVDTLRDRGYRVAGDLEDLRAVDGSSGRAPDEYTPDELLEASLDGLAAMVEEYATSWWARKKESIDSDTGTAPPRREARGLLRRARRGARRLAARTPGLRGLAARDGRPPVAR